MQHFQALQDYRYIIPVCFWNVKKRLHRSCCQFKRNFVQCHWWKLFCKFRQVLLGVFRILSNLNYFVRISHNFGDFDVNDIPSYITLLQFHFLKNVSKLCEMLPESCGKSAKKAAPFMFCKWLYPCLRGAGVSLGH